MTTRYIVETEGEALTEGDMEFLGLEETEMMESIEAELAEDTATSLEDISPNSVAESLEGVMEGLEELESSRNGYTTRRTPISQVNKQLLKTFTVIVKKLVKKIKSNPRTRIKLQAAIRKGPTAVAKLITPSVAKVLPTYFRWLAPIYVPPVTRALFNPIRKEAGVEAAEVEVSSEWGAEWDF